MVPTLRFRPKFSSDQTFQTEIISDQTFQTEIHPDQTLQTQVTSDQTFQTQELSDQTFQTEGVLIRPSLEHGPNSNSHYCPDLIQTMMRLKCARRGYDQTQLRSKNLWSDPVALAAIYDQTEVRSKPAMIRLKCARRGYDQTQLRSKSTLIRLFRPNWPLIRPSPDHGPDFSDQNGL